jgi:hypothetical protein
MATKRAAKKAVKRATGKSQRRDGLDCTPVGSPLPSPQLRNMIYLWLFTTISYLPCLTEATTPADIYKALSDGGGQFKEDDNFVTSILNGTSADFDEFDDIRGVILNAKSSFGTARDGWSGQQGHPTPGELNSIFIPVSAGQKNSRRGSKK